MATWMENTTTKAVIRDMYDFFGTSDDQGHFSQVLSIVLFHVKIISANDARTSSPDFVKAKRKKFEGLYLGKLWNLVNKSNIQKNANILGGRFIHMLKNIGTLNKAAKVRLVAQGFGNKDESPMIHNTLHCDRLPFD